MVLGVELLLLFRPVLKLRYFLCISCVDLLNLSCARRKAAVAEHGQLRACNELWACRSRAQGRQKRTQQLVPLISQALHLLLTRLFLSFEPCLQVLALLLLLLLFPLDSGDKVLPAAASVLSRSEL